MKVDEILGALGEALAARDQARVMEICRTVASQVRLGEMEVPERTARKILDLLKAKLSFDELVVLGGALIRAFPENHRIRRLYVQGLIDSGQLDQALDLLEGILENPAVPPRELHEAWGLKGRVHKQSYVDSSAPPESKARWLQAALDAYARGWSDSRDPWHGINIVALLARAERDGVSLDTDHDLGELATEILDAVEDKEHPNLWDHVTAMEAELALGEIAPAIRSAEKYVQVGLAQNEGEFEFASTLRQLKEVWEVDPDGEFGAAVLPMLEAVVVGKALAGGDGSGSVQLESDSVARMNTPEAFKRLERVFGDDPFVTTRWLHQLFDRLGGIGSVATKAGKGIGTGFLVPGAVLSEDLDGDWYFVTNSHVVTDDDVLIESFPAGRRPRRPEDVDITFEIHFRDHEADTFTVAELIWTSPPDELDVSILRLDRPAHEGEIKPYPVSLSLPDPDERPRLYIAGHPAGGGLRISMHDNHLIDFDDRRIHYRTPTNPGSSGSPVFNDEWKLVGLHHAGSDQMPTLDGSGLIEANEGIRLGAILEGLKEALGSGEGSPS